METRGPNPNKQPDLYPREEHSPTVLTASFRPYFNRFNEPYETYKEAEVNLGDIRKVDARRGGGRQDAASGSIVKIVTASSKAFQAVKRFGSSAPMPKVHKRGH